MSGKKSIFSRYFAVCTVSVVGSILVLGVTLFLFALQYFQGEKYNLLQKKVRNAAALTLSNYASNSYNYLDYSTVSNGYRLLSLATDADIFFTDTQGRTRICSDETPCEHTTYTVPQEVMAALKQEKRFRELGTLGGMYKESYYTVGLPLAVGDNEPFGAVFVSYPAQSFTQFVSRALKIFALSSLVVLLLSFALVYYVTARMVRPIRQMVQATHSFSKGDFTQRIAVSDETEIGQLAQAFNNMATDLAQIESTRRSFIANVSHELKTPMTTIIGFVEGILDGTIPPEQHEHYLKIVLAEAQRLSRLVRAMLDIAKIEAGELKLSPTVFDINETVCRALFPFERKIEEKRLEIRGLDVPEKVLVFADADLIHQVVYNLIDNAIKFSDDGGYIEFRYATVRNQVYVSVRNSGQGITEEECAHIFERFYKTDKSRSRDKQGVGLGLHIVKSVINFHGGDITVHSVPGKYTEFTFTLPTPPKKNAYK